MQEISWLERPPFQMVDGRCSQVIELLVNGKLLERNVDPTKERYTFLAVEYDRNPEAALLKARSKKPFLLAQAKKEGLLIDAEQSI